jgi:hypothetical protein
MGPMLDSDNPAAPATDDCEAPTSKRAELSQRFLIDSIAMRCLQSVSQGSSHHHHHHSRGGVRVCWEGRLTKHAQEACRYVEGADVDGREAQLRGVYGWPDDIISMHCHDVEWSRDADV